MAGHHYGQRDNGLCSSLQRVFMDMRSLIEAYSSLEIDAKVTDVVVFRFDNRSPVICSLITCTACGCTAPPSAAVLLCINQPYKPSDHSWQQESLYWVSLQDCSQSMHCNIASWCRQMFKQALSAGLNAVVHNNGVICPQSTVLVDSTHTIVSTTYYGFILS